MEHIDVTFGGRSVRLKPLQPHSDAFWTSDQLDLCRLGPHWYASLKGKLGRIGLEERADSPQEAVSAVESKLRDLRDQLTSILGE